MNEIGFFRISINEITHILQIIQGEMIIYGDIDMEEIVPQTRKNAFTNGQRIKHTTCKSKHEWIGLFDNNHIKCNGRVFKSLNQFAECHYIEERPDRVSNVNCDGDFRRLNMLMSGGWNSRQ